ncbi:hypothetical protein [Ruegeria lacuscaerulensis]|uniref:hypothetical protein n=1 Tax=Ruegeria lacuscaerulensis TaxID=55218 RepID=UPI00147CB07A|nr:hypothetical protein [Ruegeria lacuscaerulensis]
MIEQPLTIYFDLSPDARPTIGAVGEAMVQFERMAGETVFLMEPGIEFSLVYQYSAPGSLRIIAGLRGLVTKERLSTLAIIIATTLVNNGLSHIQGKAMDEAIRAVAGAEANTLTDEDIKRIAEAVRSVERSETVTQPRREFYRAVEPDKAITGIGAAPSEKAAPPAVVVPRAEFNDRAGPAIETLIEEIESQRVVSERTEVVLVQPPLIESNRQWRFFWNGQEKGAKMLDEHFKQQVLEGTTDLKLAGGVILDVTLETTQVKRGGLWHNNSFAVVQVHGWRQNAEQAELLLSHGSDDDDQNDQNTQ